jgi:CHAD domain-containing protein
MADPFVLRRKESLEKAFRRIADQQLTRAANALTVDDLAVEARVHEARKRFKESRALMRLYRDALGDAFDEQNRWYRDAGRLLAPYRDASATVSAVDAIDDEATKALRTVVRERRDALYADSTTLDETVSELLTRFPAERLRVRDLALRDVDDAVEAGFASAISAGRKAMNEAYETGAAGAFHEWRKRVKDQWYHVRLFARVWPKLMAIHDAALHELSDLLGEHHDLTVVGEVDPQLAVSIAERQQTIAAKACSVAEPVYASRARDRAREVMALWRVWRG